MEENEATAQSATRGSGRESHGGEKHKTEEKNGSGVQSSPVTCNGGMIKSGDWIRKACPIASHLHPTNHRRTDLTHFHPNNLNLPNFSNFQSLSSISRVTNSHPPHHYSTVFLSLSRQQGRGRRRRRGKVDSQKREENRKWRGLPIPSSFLVCSSASFNQSTFKCR